MGGYDICGKNWASNLVCLDQDFIQHDNLLNSYNLSEVSQIWLCWKTIRMKDRKANNRSISPSPSYSDVLAELMVPQTVAHEADTELNKTNWIDSELTLWTGAVDLGLSPLGFKARSCPLSQRSVAWLNLVQLYVLLCWESPSWASVIQHVWCTQRCKVCRTLTAAAPSMLLGAR